MVLPHTRIITYSRKPHSPRLWEVRKYTAGPSEVLLQPRTKGDLRLVFSSVPRQAAQSVGEENPEFNYLAGTNEVDFAWTLYRVLKKLVAVGKQLHPIAFSKQMYVGGCGAVRSANQPLWKANLLISRSTKANRKEAKRFLNELKLRLGGTLPQYFEALVKAPGSGLEFTGSLEVIEAYQIIPRR